MAFLAYMDKLRVEDRPKVIVLECVANLGDNRAIKGRTEKGTALVVDALRERGYAREWRKITATRFCLPQRRPRARGLFIKLHGGLEPKTQESARQSLKVGMDIARTAECAGHEPLDTILARAPSTFAYKSSRPNGPKRYMEGDPPPYFPSGTWPLP